MKHLPRAAIYARISQNREDDASKPDRQIERCRDLIRAKELDEAHAPFVDDDISAYKAKLRRPDYEELLQLIEDGEIDVVVTWHIDRMLRTVKEMVSFIELAERTGVRIESVQGGSLDLSTPAGRLMATILAAVAQAESELKSERHKLRNVHAAKDGKSLGGPTPFGWQTPAQTEALRSGIKAYLAGETLSSIARDWNDRDLLTTFDQPWNHNNVRKVLIRPRNAGLVEHQKKIVPGAKGQWEAVCTEDEHRKMVAIAESAKVGHRPAEHLLSGLLTCSNGHKMTSGVRTSRGNKPDGKRYNYMTYRCTVNGCLTNITRDSADDVVRQLVRHRLIFGDISALAPATKDLHKAVELRETLGGLMAERTQLERLLADRALTPQGFRNAVTAINLDIETTSTKLAKIESQNAFAVMLSEKVTGNKVALTDAAKVGQRFDSLPLDQRRSIVKGLFPSITVQKVGRVKGRRPTTWERVTAYTLDGREYALSDDAEGLAG